MALKFSKIAWHFIQGEKKIVSPKKFLMMIIPN